MLVSMQSRGLSNRLISFISASRQAKRARIIWKPNSLVGCRFKDLFVNDAEISKLPVDAQRWGSWRMWISEAERKEFGIQHIDFMYEKTPSALTRRILPYVNRLEVTEELSNRIQSVTQELPSDAVAVQVRSWSEPAGKRRRKSFSLKEYFDELDKFDGRTIYFTGDSGKILKKAQQRYGQRVICANKSLGSHDRAGIQSAVVDLYVSAKLPVIIGCSISTFTELSWWLSQCQSRVIRVC